MTLAGVGTPEATWQAWADLRPSQPLDLTGCTRLVLVAPHPDDEILGAGGLLRQAAAAGDQLEIVAVTDGHASHPGSPTLDPGQLVTVRRAESAEALHRLGITPTVHRLGHPDGRVAEVERALGAYLTALLGPDEGTWCLTTWEHDGHPDHEATGRAAVEACLQTGRRLLRYPVWTWHWAGPADPRVPWSTARTVDLSPSDRQAKHDAVAAFVSQLHPLSEHPADAAILPPPFLARLLRPFEVVLT